MIHCIIIALSIALCVSFSNQAMAVEHVRLEATADASFSSMLYKGVDYRITSMGKYNQFKLKSVQEMAAIKFNCDPARGREVVSARLYLHNATEGNRIRILRMSTINGDWNEGDQTEKYGPPSGACFNYADWDTKKEWGWPGSQLCDVVLGAGHSLTTWKERREEKDGWISVPVPPELIYAMCVGDSDGLLLQDAGDLSFTNNFMHSRESGRFAPYMELQLGAALSTKPSTPVVSAMPAPEVAKQDSGSIKIKIAEASNTHCWKIKANGKTVERWQVPHPGKGETVFYLEYLEAGKPYSIEVTGVSSGGIRSQTVTVKTQSSPVLQTGYDLGTFKAPDAQTRPLKGGSAFDVWACPGLVKISPESGKVMFKDLAGNDGTTSNALWDGTAVSLFGCRGEYVSFQLIVEKHSDALRDIQVQLEQLKHKDGSTINKSEIELYKNWYAKNKDEQWQPAYCQPLKHGQTFAIPDPIRKMEGQNNQGIYVDIYIPKDALPGYYDGTVSVKAGDAVVEMPVRIEVFDFLMPDKLSFWPQLNCYVWGIKEEMILPVYQLAHQHRNVFFYRGFKPTVSGTGQDIKADWTQYDALVGPLLSGDAFKDNRRQGVPTPAIALPFEDSWPTNLTPETYHYKGRWVLEKGGKHAKKNKKLMAYINEHYMTCPPIEEGLSQQYKDAFIAMQQQFIEHYKEKGWDQAEVQCLYMGKNTHRIKHAVNMWWTTDEPYHWIDWLAIRFFGKLWTEHRGAENAKQWVFRADISRQQWQGTILDDVVDNIYYGAKAFSSPTMYRRVELLERNGGFDTRVYGSANHDNLSNHGPITWFMNSWMHGANAALPWQGMGKEEALDINDRAVGGNALIVPAQERLGVPVLADIRLKSFRDGQQLIEYLCLFAERYNLTRSQVAQIVKNSVQFEAGIAKGAGADNADALRFTTLQSWQIQQLRYALAQAISKHNQNK